MRLPSIEQLARAGRQSAGRFPLVLLSAAVSAVAAGLMPDSRIDEEILTRILYAASLGISLLLAIDLVAERRSSTAAGRWIARLGAAAALVGLYFACASWSEPVRVLRYVQLSVAAHLLVAVAPYTGVREWNGFWQYNRGLLLRFLLSGVFSVVLYAGLTVALLAVDNLLDIEVADKTYFRLWCGIAFVFNTWFFTAGVPKDLERLDRRDDYPPALKVLSQYVLSPLVTVYMLIVMLYLGRIVITRVWPSGWIGYLVSSVAAAGILSLLLLYPVEEREENRWVRQYARWFYVGLIPANAMLLLAIWKRIQQYAITEPRYFLVVLSLWLAGISLFYVFSRSRNIKVIPASLAVLAVVTLAGPWSAYAVSRRSQTARLQHLLERHSMLADGRVHSPPGSVPVEDRREISAVLRYLTWTHGTGSIESWFPEGRLAEVDTIAPVTERAEGTERRQANESAALIAAEMGIEYVGSWTPGQGEDFRYAAESDGPPLKISGYEFVVRNRDVIGDTTRADGAPYDVVWDENGLTVTLLLDGQTAAEFPLAPLLDSVRAHARSGPRGADVPADLLTARQEGDGVRAAMAVTAIRGYVEEGRGAGERDAPVYRVTDLTADFYFGDGL